MKKSGKKWIGFDFNLDKQQTVEKNQSKRDHLTENSSDKPKNKLLVRKKCNFNFELALMPKTVADLAVHSKKIKEVEMWLQNKVINKDNSQTASFLLITGPTGSGKSATIRVLCENMAISISEWVNPVDQDFEICRGPNQISRFSDFLSESKWNSLFTHTNKKIILVEEFPNAIIRNPENLSSILEECYYKGNCPVVFIQTDSFDNGSYFTQTLFSQEIVDKFGITHISFNACAATLIKNALRRAHNLVQKNLDLFKTPSANTLDAIIATSMGDIRCAINQYYFASLLGTTDLPTVCDKLHTKSGTKRKRSGAISSVKLMSKDENLGLFHGLGRILNPKRTEIGDSWRLNYDMQKLVDEFSTQPGVFIAFLFENYIKYFGDINDACQAAEVLSLSENLLDRWLDQRDTLTFALWIATLGLMVYNGHKVTKWNQIKGPTKIKKKINSDPAARNLSVTDLFYYNKINKCEKSQFNIRSDNFD